MTDTILVLEYLHNKTNSNAAPSLQVGRPAASMERILLFK